MKADDCLNTLKKSLLRCKKGNARRQRTNKIATIRVQKQKVAPGLGISVSFWLRPFCFSSAYVLLLYTDEGTSLESRNGRLLTSYIILLHWFIHIYLFLFFHKNNRFLFTLIILPFLFSIYSLMFISLKTYNFPCNLLQALSWK